MGPASFLRADCCLLLFNGLDVPVPSDFSIPYTDLELTTPDDVKIKAFLMLQRHVLNMNESPIEWDEQSKVDVSQMGFSSLVYSRNLTGLTVVCRNATNGTHVSW